MATADAWAEWRASTRQPDVACPGPVHVGLTPRRSANPPTLTDLMRAVLQRVSRAKVTIAGEIAGEIGSGLLVLLGVTHADTPEQAKWLAEKIAGLRIFNDADGKMNRDVTEAGGSMLIVSQ